MSAKKGLSHERKNSKNLMIDNERKKIILEAFHSEVHKHYLIIVSNRKKNPRTVFKSKIGCKSKT